MSLCRQFADDVIADDVIADDVIADDVIADDVIADDVEEMSKPLKIAKIRNMVLVPPKASRSSGNLKFMNSVIEQFIGEQFVCKN